MKRNELERGSEKAYILAGRAILTVKSERSGNHFTYKVKAANDTKNAYFVSVKNSSDGFLYMGMLKSFMGNWDFILTPKSKVGKDASSFKVFKYIVDRYINAYYPHNEMTLLHSGKCAKCGRELTEPDSLRIGLGPVCRQLK